MLLIEATSEHEVVYFMTQRVGKLAFVTGKLLVNEHVFC